MNKIPVGVTCVGSLVGQGVVKSLLACDLADRLEIVGFEYLPGTAGSYWIETTHLMPDILKPEVTFEGYLERFIPLVRRHALRVLFIGIGFELPHFAAARERIEAETGCIVLVGSPGAVAAADDKYATFVALRDAGLAPPASFLPGDDLCALPYPVIVKPRRGTGSKGLRLAAGADSLAACLPLVADPVIQEAVGDADSEYTCGVLRFDGRVENVICLRRRLRDGNTNVAWNTPDTPPAVAEAAARAADALDVWGPANVQLRLDATGRARVFEINLRFSGSTGMRTQFGVNEPEYALKRVLGLPLPAFTPRFGKVLRYPEEIYDPEGR